MKAGDLVRYCGNVAGQNLRLVQKVRDLKNLEIFDPYGIMNSDGVCFVAYRTFYKPTTMTIEDCAWLSKKGYKVTLRDLSYEEMVKVCKEAGQKNVEPSSWASIHERCLDKTFITKKSASSHTEKGWVIIIGTYCPCVVSTCCLTLAAKQPTVKAEEPIVKAKEPTVDSIELTSYELLHGPQEHEEIEDIEPEVLEIQPPIGWDNCSKGFCLGDWLITRRQALWIISHPEIIISNTFSNPQLAADFIERLWA